MSIGTVDVLFALDSIPAIFGVTEEAYIVFAANAFALLGLRALYFLVSGLLDRLVYLSTGLSLILLFIGVKLVLHYLHKQDDSDSGGIDRPVARGDRHDPRRGDDRQRGDDAPGSLCARPRRVAPRSRSADAEAPGATR